jgi:ferrous iron transport protein B
MPLVAIVGNPNAGKTTLFNALTGSAQKVGNYPGVTVERVSATLDLGSRKVEAIDIPGLYSLNAQSEDEHVALEALLGQKGHPKPDLLVVVVNADNLERNLFLYSQLADQGLPLVVALTMTDVLRSRGAEFDLARLSNLLGVEVIPVVGHKEVGLRALREAIERNLEQPNPPGPVHQSIERDAKVALLRERLARYGLDVRPSELRSALDSPGSDLERQLEEIPELADVLAVAREEIGPVTATGSETADRYHWAAMVQQGVVTQVSQPKKADLTQRIDRILTHRFFGLIVFVGLMYLVFQSIYTLATPLMDWIEGGVGWIGETVGARLEGNPMVRDLVVDGIIAGVGSVLVFLPQILILFFFIAVLEGTGYLSRAAFLMDRLLGWCGMNGRAFIPLLSSFACAIPGIMAARVMPDQRSRLATILVAPLMSCSARLPVYVLLIGAFIQPTFGSAWAGFALFAMHFLGLLVAIPIVYILNRGVLKGKRLPFLLELPPYQWPKRRDVWLAVWIRGKVFLKTAGTIIFFMSIVIWGLSYFPRADMAALEKQAVARQLDQAQTENFIAEAHLEQSYLGRMGKAIEPVFIPAGFDWRISTSILAAFPAREVVVSAMGIIFGLGGEQDQESLDMREKLQGATWPDGKKLFTPWTAVGLMVFFALCAQCMATLAAVKRETNSWKWAAFMFVYMTGLAYLAAVGIHQLSRIFG